MLCLPYLSLAAWLAASGKLASIAAFAASVLLIGGLLAIVARTWRRFFWLNAPFWLLAVVFAGYTLTYGDVPGELLAYVLATSSWEEVRGFFGIWQGERLLVEAAVLAAIYLVLAARSPQMPIFSRSVPAWRLQLPAAIVVLCAHRRPESRRHQGGPRSKSARRQHSVRDRAAARREIARAGIGHSESALRRRPHRRNGSAYPHHRRKRAPRLLVGLRLFAPDHALSRQAAGPGNFLPARRRGCKRDDLRGADPADRHVTESIRPEGRARQPGGSGGRSGLLHGVADEPGPSHIAAHGHSRGSHGLSTVLAHARLRQVAFGSGAAARSARRARARHSMPDSSACT